VAKKKMKYWAVEVTCGHAIETYSVIAEGAVQARDMLVKYLGDRSWKNIRARDIKPTIANETARVVGRLEE
jgi:hypothetical protein